MRCEPRLRGNRPTGDQASQDPTGLSRQYRSGARPNPLRHASMAPTGVGGNSFLAQNFLATFRHFGLAFRNSKLETRNSKLAPNSPCKHGFHRRGSPAWAISVVGWISCRRNPPSFQRRDNSERKAGGLRLRLIHPTVLSGLHFHSPRLSRIRRFGPAWFMV